MKYSTYKNPLYNWWKNTMRVAKSKNTYVYPDWTTWRGFAKWCEENGYDENSEFHCTTNNPVTPEYLGLTRCVDRDCEYIAYEADDPYELIVTSASYVDELAEKLKRLGYDYDAESINSALSRNTEDRPTEERSRGLIFEKIDLTDYEETDEPFEERN